MTVYKPSSSRDISFKTLVFPNTLPNIDGMERFFVYITKRDRILQQSIRESKCNRHYKKKKLKTV